MIMKTEKELLLEAIDAEPGEPMHRQIYADWLDDHGEHDEADRQRNYEASMIP